MKNPRLCSVYSKIAYLKWKVNGGEKILSEILMFQNNLICMILQTNQTEAKEGGDVSLIPRFWKLPHRFQRSYTRCDNRCFRSGADRRYSGMFGQLLWWQGRRSRLPPLLEEPDKPWRLHLTVSGADGLSAHWIRFPECNRARGWNSGDFFGGIDVDVISIIIAQDLNGRVSLIAQRL